MEFGNDKPGKSMKEFEFKPIIKEFLGRLNLDVSDIPPKNAKTPDFEVRDKNSSYVIELKIKGDDVEERRKESQALVQGEIVSSSIPTGPRNRMYGIIKEGVEQIAEHDPLHSAFHIIWLHSTGIDADLLNRRFLATLFGKQDLISMERENLITCYYFHESVFYSCRNELDGAILSCPDESGFKIQLCINTLSPNIGIFRKADLYKNLSKKGVYDPDLFCGAMVVDCDIDRKKIDEVMKFLREKYKLKHLQTIDMKQHSARMLLPDDKTM
jgi:hypothetical protein